MADTNTPGSGYGNMGKAAGVDLHTFAPGFQLFAGEGPIRTGQATYAQDTPRFTVMQDGTGATAGKLVPWDGTPGKATAVAAAAALANQPGPTYTGAYFNHEALLWPAGNLADTLDERKAAFPPLSMITVGKLL